MNEISFVVKKARVEKGVTLKQMSKDLKIPLTTINSWERGNGRPKANNRMKVASYLGIDPELLARPNPILEAEATRLEAYETRPIMLHKNVWAGFESMKMEHEDMLMLLTRIYTELVRKAK